VVCTDDPGASALAIRPDRRRVGYGLGEGARLRAEAVTSTPEGSRFRVVRDGLALGEASLPLPGRHNVSNALAAIAIGLELGIPFATVRDRLADFAGVARRFERRGERDGVLVVDDYAHHPTEIAATLSAARQAFPGRRLVAAFQPHLYSRTEAFADGFGQALTAADVVLVLPIFPARERPVAGVSAALVAAAATARGHAEVLAPASAEAALTELDRRLRPGDVLLTLGAGDVDRLGETWLEGRR
jgi:UDP-N-acetylmuramate--alanine ligase